MGSKNTAAAPSLEELRAELQKCVKCGACQGVCPIYAETRRETDVARGKLSLLEAATEGSLPYSSNYDQILNNCLLCLACVESCSSSVRVDRLIVQARQALVETRGLPRSRRSAHALLKSGQRRLNYLLQGGSLLQSLLLRRVPQSSGLRRRFPLPGVQADQILPRLTLRPFRQRHPEHVQAPEAVQKAIFFTGCSTNYIFPEIGEAVLKVLGSLGVSLVIPAAQGCCGAPVEAAGDSETFISLARSNLQALLQQDPELKVLVCCSSGGYMLKKVYPELLAADAQLAGPARDLASRTFDISEYLVQVIGLDRIAAKITSPILDRTTYHDPCHLKRGQGISQEPRQLLELCCGEKFLEMRDADRCCGLGGTYGLTHREMSKRIRHRKLEVIQEVQAELVATGCPACMLQLREGLHHFAPGIQVKHTIQVLARAMGLEQE
ncbi:MAG: (Fe-S)-binding protein [Desulfohalobiaceae bacterium]